MRHWKRGLGFVVRDPAVGDAPNLVRVPRPGTDKEGALHGRNGVRSFVLCGPETDAVMVDYLLVLKLDVACALQCLGAAQQDVIDAAFYANAQKVDNINVIVIIVTISAGNGRAAGRYARFQCRPH